MATTKVIMMDKAKIMLLNSYLTIANGKILVGLLNDNQAYVSENVHHIYSLLKEMKEALRNEE